MIKHHTISFYHAFQGLLYALKTQPNFIIHSIISVIVITTAYFFKLSSTEWLILTLVVCLGLVIELINTAIESTVDLITQQHNHFAKIAKDTSAAAMLVYALGAVLIAIIIFYPKIAIWLSI